MPENDDGIAMMRRRVERSARRPPPPRHAASTPPEPRRAPEPASPPAPDAGEGEAPAPARRARPAPPRRAVAAGVEPSHLAADAPEANLAIRVRRPLDDRLGDLVHQLRRSGVKTSKVELVELLLWELPSSADEPFRERLKHFRRLAARGAAGPDAV